jgi:ribosomal protein S18 acetylase RimI-like enzyme
MEALRLRPMTVAEFGTLRSQLIGGYADDRAQAGDWAPEEAERRAMEQVDMLLPDGTDTAGMLILTGETAEGDAVGHVWIALGRPFDPAGSAWVYDIEVRPEQRGKGYGRALLHAAEREASARGCAAIGLNVFARNEVARGLYASAGYEATSLQLRKVLPAVN